MDRLVRSDQIMHCICLFVGMVWSVEWQYYYGTGNEKAREWQMCVQHWIRLGNRAMALENSE